MWPLLLDMTKEESIQYLRNLELEAYSQLVSALRAQGPLSSDKRKLLKDTGSLLNITQERHKAEVRRAINDEKLNTIAYHITGHTASSEDWAQEGRRLIPLLPRTAPQTVFSALADEVAESAIQCNKQLPLPANTERKRQAVSQINPALQENIKNIPFRVPEIPKSEENKKRKLQMNPENSSLAQHLLSPKFCRIQQLYRQRTKPKAKEIHKKIDHDSMEVMPQHRNMQPLPLQSTIICPPTLPNPPQQSQTPQHSNHKVTVLQNISLQPIKEEILDQGDGIAEQVPTAHTCVNENQAPRQKIVTNVKPNSSITIKPNPMQIPGPSSETQKIKLASAKKTITKTVSSGQKLIVVSNAQTITTNSILQRTLQIPFVKNVSLKNFDKFKIVTTNSSPTSIQVANVTNSAGNPVKHKVVTVKTNPLTKKVIPLSQLQVLNSKGSIKVLPLGGKIVGKTVGTSPLYIMNATHLATKHSPISQTNTANKINTSEEIKSLKTEPNLEQHEKIEESVTRENGKSSVLADILKASGVITDTEDYDAKIEEFHIPQNKLKIEDSEESEALTESREEESDFEKTKDQTVEYEILDVKEESVESESKEAMDEYVATEIVNKEVIESEHDFIDVIKSEDGMSHVEEIVEHDFHEITIKSEEEIPHVILQVDCPSEKNSVIADDN